LSGTYTPDATADGRGAISATTNGTYLGGLNLEYYVIDGSTVAFIDVDSTTLDAGQLGVGVFEAQTSPSASVASHNAVSVVRPRARAHAAFQRK
jgi:hypothetical protein